MNQIISMCIEAGETRWLGEMPPELMTKEEAEWVHFILSYERSHGSPPTLGRLMERFDDFIPYRFTSSLWEPIPPPLGDVFQQTVERKLFTTTERLLVDIESTMTHEGRVPLERVSEIQRLHTLSLGVHRYSSFDRSLYFRRPGFQLPFRLINRHTGGVGTGDFMLIVGRLGTGKSTITQWIGKYAWEQGLRVLYVSAEMLAVDVFARIDAMMGKFNPLLLRSEAPDAAMRERLDRLADRATHEGGEIIIPRTRLLNPSQIGAFSRNLGIDLIIVDGAYLLQPSSGRYTSKWEKVATVSNELKQLAMDLDIPLLGTAQIKRGASGAEGYDPEDIALSDALGQDADFVLALYPNPTVKGRTELQLIKNRYGSKCATQLMIDFDTMTVTDETVMPSEPMSVAEWMRGGD